MWADFFLCQRGREKQLSFRNPLVHQASLEFVGGGTVSAHDQLMENNDKEHGDLGSL